MKNRNTTRTNILERLDPFTIFTWFLLITTMAAMFTLIFTFKARNERALEVVIDADAKSPSYEVAYVEYVVENGDSISYIAAKFFEDYPGSFEEYQSKIRSENDISNPNFIRIGTVLTIPVYKEVKEVVE